jgi:fatty-acyl-CoA synthase
MTASPLGEPLIVDGLSHAARLHAHTTALIDLATHRRFTYEHFFVRVCRLANALTERGVGRGDRVMAIVRNSTDVYEMMFACWRMGAAFMPINWRLAGPELAEIMGDGDPALVVVDEEFRTSIDPGSRSVITRLPGAPQSEYERLIAASSNHHDFVPQNLDDMNLLLYTSGTTGRPKGVIGTWRMTLTMLMQSAAMARLGPGCVTLTAAPLFHTAGLNSYATPTLYVGGTIAVMGAWSPESCLDALCDPTLAVTHTLGVPTQFMVMARHPKFPSARFPALRIAAIGGAPPTADLMQTWAAKGCALSPGYGMTEVFGGANFPHDEALKKLGAVGRAVPMVQTRVADEQGQCVPDGVVAEIQFKGPGVTPGYWRQPDATQAAFIDGWLRTGDIGYMDGDGVLFLVDRKKDMFISGGENVYPAEVENVLAGFAEVAHVAVIGVPDETWGEVGRAVVVLRADTKVDAGALLARCRGLIAPYKVPKSIVVVPELPLSAQGKVLKTELRRRYG